MAGLPRFQTLVVNRSQSGLAPNARVRLAECGEMPQNEENMLQSLRLVTAKTATATALGALCLAAMPAHADRTPAPIVFVGEDGTRHEVGQVDTAGQGRAAQPTPSGSRVEFRYPDQPDRFYSGNGVRVAETDAPIAFSSSTAAITQEEARNYAAIETPQAAQPFTSSDPALTRGGFDARATAARLAEREQSAASSRDEPAAETYSLPGQVHQPASVQVYDERGSAAVYSDAFEGQPTANGELFTQDGLSGAHPSLPIPSLVQVINEDNGREVVVRVNDRGPFQGGRMMDLSRRAGDLLGIRGEAVANIRVRYLGPAPVQATGAPVRQPVARTVSSDVVVERPMPELPQVARAQPQPQPRSQQPADGSFFIQLGSFSDIGNAQRLTSSLDATLDVDIVPARVNNADWFRVWVGPFADRAAAERVQRDLSRRGVVAGFVVTGS